MSILLCPPPKILKYCYIENGNARGSMECKPMVILGTRHQKTPTYKIEYQFNYLN